MFLSGKRRAHCLRKGSSSALLLCLEDIWPYSTISLNYVSIFPLVILKEHDPSRLATVDGEG